MKTDGLQHVTDQGQGQHEDVQQCADHDAQDDAEDADLLVLGSRGYGPRRAVLLGGVSGRVVRRAACPVIVVPRAIEKPLEELFLRDQASADARFASRSSGWACR